MELTSGERDRIERRRYPRVKISVQLELGVEGAAPLRTEANEIALGGRLLHWNHVHTAYEPDVETDFATHRTFLVQSLCSRRRDLFVLIHLAVGNIQNLVQSLPVDPFSCPNT